MRELFVLVVEPHLLRFVEERNDFREIEKSRRGKFELRREIDQFLGGILFRRFAQFLLDDLFELFVERAFFFRVVFVDFKLRLFDFRLGERGRLGLFRRFRGGRFGQDGLRLVREGQRNRGGRRDGANRKVNRKTFPRQGHNVPFVSFVI